MGRAKHRRPMAAARLSRRGASSAPWGGGKPPHSGTPRAQGSRRDHSNQPGVKPRGLAPEDFRPEGTAHPDRAPTHAAPALRQLRPASRNAPRLAESPPRRIVFLQTIPHGRPARSGGESRLPPQGGKSPSRTLPGPTEEFRRIFPGLSRARQVDLKERHFPGERVCVCGAERHRINPRPSAL